MADIGFELLAKSDTLSFKAGDVIFREGDEASAMYVI